MISKKALIILVIFILMIFGQPCALAVSNDWICIPGERVGPITKDTNEKDLINMFGKNNVKTVKISASEEMGTPEETVSYIFPNSLNEIHIRWKNQRPWIITIYKQGTRWKMLEGNTVGTSLEEMIKINKKDFIIAGFGWEYGGWVSSWNGGEIEKKYKGKIDMFFDEGSGTLKDEEFMGDKKRIKTDNIQLLRIKPKVKSLNIMF